MDRRLMACLLGLGLAGCAVSRSGMPGARGRAPSAAPTAPVEMGTVEALPSASDALARGYADRDAATRRAGQAPESSPVDDPSPSPSSARPPLPPGRRAPFADQTEGTPRGQSDGPAAGPRPAPFAEVAPGGPRPQAPAPAEASPRPATSAPPEAVPGPPPSPFPDAPPPSSPPPLSAADAPVDPQVRPTSLVVPENPPVAPAPGPAGGKLAVTVDNGKAAMVGTEVITERQLRTAIAQNRKKFGIPDDQWRSPAIKKKVFDVSLKGLIDRALLVQAAKKKIKDMKSFYTEIDRVWVDTELPPLLREHGVSNIHELKRKLAAEGKSLDQIREDFRQTVLARDFMSYQIKDKVHVSLPEMMAYYEKNREQFRRPAQVTWREIEVDISKCSGRAEARSRAEAMLTRLRQGDDFARLAKTASHGATARDGGLWQTAPGSSANPDINAAITALAPGQTSGIIEAPGSFHIVRLDARREAGIAPFYEVQDRVKEDLTMEKGNAAADALLESLRKKTVVTTIFDAPDRDPAAVRTGARAAAPARR